MLNDCALISNVHISLVKGRQLRWFGGVWVTQMPPFLYTSTIVQDRREREQQDLELAKEIAEDDEEDFP